MIGEKTIATVGLGTFSFIALEIGPKTLDAKITFPELDKGSSINAQVIVTVNINGGSPVYTGMATAQGFRSGGYAVAIGDVFNVIYSSSQIGDTGPTQAIRSVISFY
jgi:hypothetical protein